MVEKQEGTRQRTYMNDPQIWITVWGLTVGVGVGLDGGGQKGGKLEQL